MSSRAAMIAAALFAIVEDWKPFSYCSELYMMFNVKHTKFTVSRRDHMEVQDL